MDIPVELILRNPEQPRTTFDSEEMALLTISVREHGVINAISVEGPHLDEEGREYYVLIDGERRWRAAKLAGLATVPANVRPSMNGEGETKRLAMAMAANLQRAKMSPLDEARGYARLKALGMRQREIARAVSKHEVYISQVMALLDLEPEIQELIERGELPHDYKAVTALRKVPARARVELARQIARPGVTIHRVIAMCERSTEKVVRAVEEMRTTLPAVDFARVQAHEGKGRGPLPDWDMLRAQKRLPPWHVVRDAAKETCDICPLRREASLKTCQDCPAVQLIARMLGGTVSSYQSISYQEDRKR